MKIKEKIELDYNGLVKYGPINIVAFGDSVTHGAVGFDEIDYETVYWNRLKKKLNNYRDYIPVNVINAGIGGITAGGSLDRMEAQVFDHHPDLVIICFGLNDINDSLENFIYALGKMFDRCNKDGIDVIYMTPNMMNTYVTERIKKTDLADYAKYTAEVQSGGKMDTYIDAARKLAAEKNVTVCDCYAKWKKLSETEDTTKLLANDINHPLREMHELFAEELYKCIIGEESKTAKESCSTMFDQN